MGYLYEELIRRFSELSNETAGEHFTPREVIRLMVNLLFIDDADDVLTKPGILKTLCDPACGTGGMLSVAGLAGPARKAVWSTLAVREEKAPILTDRKGNPRPDPEVRDNENVPLPAVSVSFAEDPTERFATLEYQTAVDDYLREEVLPSVPARRVDAGAPRPRAARTCTPRS